MKLGRWLLGVVGLLLLVAWGLMQPWGVSALVSHPAPVQEYPQALQRLAQWQAAEADLQPACRTRLLTHGRAVARVVVLVHGYTSCPQQFHALGQQLFEGGANVLMVPMPHHGLSDRLSHQHGQLTAQALVNHADQLVDVAVGLGHQRVVVGMSAGAVVAAWAGQFRPEVDLAVMVSPLFGVGMVPEALTVAASNLASWLPNRFVWWDDQLQAERGPAHAYPRYATRAVGQILRLGLAVQAAAGVHAAPARMLVVSHDQDETVSHARTRRMLSLWQTQGSRVQHQQLQLGVALGHDVIDPRKPDAQVDRVYPQLLAWMEQALTPDLLPIIDMHLHYGGEDAQALTPAEVLALFDRNGIRRGLVSSTPNDGTQALYAAAPERIIPFLGIYHSLREKGVWGDDETVIVRVEQWLSAGGYRGIGEFHLFREDKDSPVLRRLVAMAAQQGLMLQVHGDAELLASIMDMAPQVTVLWAHLGTQPEPALLADMLRRFPRQLYIDTSVRDALFTDAQGRLKDEWRALFMAHADRFVVGVDTFSVNRWRQFDAVVAQIRHWLGQLPEPVAHQLAYGNAQRLLAQTAR